MGRHSREPSSPGAWTRVASAARSVRDVAQPIVWIFAFHDDAANTANALLAASTQLLKSLSDLVV